MDAVAAKPLSTYAEPHQVAAEQATQCGFDILTAHCPRCGSHVALNGAGKHLCRCGSWLELTPKA